MVKIRTPKKGARVFAYDTGTRNTINVYGPGTYAGLADRYDGFFDHRIELDSGDVVWGSEVNWVHESWERTVVAGRRQVQIPVATLQSA